MVLSSYKITGAVFDIIHGATDELVLVSPRVSLTYWQKMATAIKAARDRGVHIDFFIRSESAGLGSKQQVEALGIVPYLIPNLRATFYYNATSGLLTSMNLLHTADGNSIESGCHLDSQSEIDGLRRFVKQHLLPPKTWQPPKTEISAEDRHIATAEFGQVLAAHLEAQLEKDSQVEALLNGSNLTIWTLRNSFTAAIECPGNHLVLHGIVSAKEADRFATQHQPHFTTVALHYEVQPGGQGNYDQVRGTLPQSLSASSFDALTLPEKKQLLALIAGFVRAVRSFKDA
ncbi:hypothetical protein [Hymenobacter psoromatis]|uniref:hypothetical protein n=1 Tax=Hymenobacter psoromatis TaxID=1484116 RepID=UPI001CBF6D46|nr:hypothetical protein [Hymenobacter psoromatis]